MITSRKMSIIIYLVLNPVKLNSLLIRDVAARSRLYEPAEGLIKVSGFMIYI